MPKKRRNRDDVKSLNPRSNVVFSKSKPGGKQYQFKIRTDYDQRLWPAPKVEKHGTG